MRRKFRFLLILALFISVFLEITLFNYTHYATLFTSEHFSLAYYKQEQRFVSNANEYEPYNFSVRDSLLLPESQHDLKFRNLNTEIASVYIDPIFIQGDKQRVRVYWEDEESSGRSIDVSIIKDLNFSNYVSIAPRGKVSYLSIIFLNDINVAIKQVELNKKIPMAIMPIRMVIVFCISLLLLCLLNAELREKISYFCFDYMYDKTSFRQRIGFATLICSMLVFNFIISYSLYGFKDNETILKRYKMYSHHMTDALLKRQLHLDLKVPQALLTAERPYDEVYRKRNGLIVSGSVETDTLENAIFWDYAYYKGKYYSYYGVLPAIILFAPYKLITGNYLPNSMGAFLFGSIATILLMLLWKQIAQNYLKKIPYFFFLIGAATLYACPLIPAVLSSFSTIFFLMPQFSALAFVILGIIILLQAKEKLSIKYLIISSLSFALAVACRQSALFWSIFIPVLLWDKRKEINVSKVLAIVIPFIIVGLILAWYNYARFDYPFEFGLNYTINRVNFMMINKISIIEKIPSYIESSLFMLFNPPNLDLTFPFITAKILNRTYPLDRSTMGIFYFPIVWFLFYVRKIDILRNFIFAGIFISLLNVALLSFISIGWRYNLDFAWIMTIGALICAFQLQEKYTAMRKIILKAFYSCSGITLMLVFFLAMSFIKNDKIYNYLARTFGVIGNVP